MGARQSYLYIFLDAMDETYGDGLENQSGYTVQSSKGVYTGCDSFEVVTHKITITKGDPKSYDIYIYKSRSEHTKASYVFAYCSPGSSTHVVKEVRAYYSILSPHNPLVISFQREKDCFDCSFDKLLDTGWDWASSISAHSSTNLTSLLQEQYTKLSWDYSIEFTDGKDNKNIMANKYDIDNDKFYRVILVPKKEQGTLGIQSMYFVDPKNFKVDSSKHASGSQTQIDTYFLNGIFKQYFFGIVLYFARKGSKAPDISQEKDYENTLLIAEFSNKCETISLKRKDKEGCWWVKEKLKYTNYNQRVAELTNIKNGAETNNLNTVILDKYDSYICGRKVIPLKDKGTYNKYTHQFDQSQNPNLLFKCADPGITIINTKEIKANTVDVYYLKVKTTKGDEKQDVKPFLIVFEDGDQSKTKKVYHFKENQEFKDWQVFSDVGRLDEKLVKISDRGKCTTEMGLLVKLVYKLLTSDDVPDPDKPTAPGGEKRPPVDPAPPIPPEPPNWLLIIGSSVGAFVFVCLLAIAYGIYWYNTTIKLLT